MWQFAEAVRGLADGCRELGLPVTGGNVSLYNQTGDVAINPTPVIGVLGVHEDVRRRVPGGWRTAGETVLLLGDDPAGVRRLRLGARRARPPRRASAGGRPRPPSAPWASCSPRSAATGLVSSAHDLADGGLAQTLAESALRHGVGARLHARRRPVHRAVQRVRRPRRRHHVRPGRRAATAAAGGRPGHRAGDDGRRRAGRRRPARPAARRAAGRLDGDPARRCSGRRKRRSGAVPDGRRPDQLMAGNAPIPAEELRAAVDPVRPGWPGRPSSRRGRCSAPP